jgi:N-hydroxyarylamine O-acetyltransferase
MDLTRYLQRIEHDSNLAPNLETLRSLHLAHGTHIPFENLDVLLKRPIRLDLDSLSKKLIEDRRGGYCFEQNALFAAVLETIGLPVKRLAARVRLGALEPRPRTHMLLLVEADAGRWLCDVGFGGEGLLRPMPFRPGEISDHFGWKSRIVEEGGLFVLQSLHSDGWHDLYVFNLDEQFAIDYEMANFYTSTHPQSHFMHMLIVQLPGTKERLRLTNRRFTVETPAGIAKEAIIESDAELVELLAERFGLVFPKGTAFPIRDAPAD